MLFEILIVVCVAFATAGVVMLVFRLFGAKPPKTLIIGIAGLAMIAFTSWNRHGWADRTEATLPKTIQVVRKIPYSGWIEPWTLIQPRTGALVAIDHGETLRNPAHPEILIVYLLHIEQHADTLILRQIVDCGERRRAPLDTEQDFTGGDLPAGLDWTPGGEPKYLFDAVCKETPLGPERVGDRSFKLAGKHSPLSLPGLDPI